MTTLNVQGAVTSDGIQENVCVEIADGVIRNISPSHTECLPGILIPGFVDLHCHGGGGYSFDNGVEVKAAADFHAKHGTTTVIASLVSNPVDQQITRLEALKPLVENGTIGGVHMEGPFLSHHRCGAQNPAVITAPSRDDIAPVSYTHLTLPTNREV